MCLVKIKFGKPKTHDHIFLTISIDPKVTMYYPTRDTYFTFTNTHLIKVN